MKSTNDTESGHGNAEAGRPSGEEMQRLLDFAEMSSDWFWEQDAEFRFIVFSGALTERLGHWRTDLIGRRRWELPISGVSPEKLAEHIAVCQRHEPFRDFEYDICDAQGVTRRFCVSGRAVFDDAGVFCGYRGVGRNLTELRAAERAAMDSHRLLAQIVIGNPVASFVIDARHRITHWNLACENLTGVAAADIIGTCDAWRGFYKMPRPAMADLVVDGATEQAIELHYGEKFGRSKLIAGAYEAEDFFPHMREGGRWLYFTAAPLRDSAGRIIGAIETLQDVTARKLAESAEREHWSELQRTHLTLQRTVQQLIQAEKLNAMGRLVAGVAHEMNTPLGNALLIASTLREQLETIDLACREGTLKRSEFDGFRQGGIAAFNVLESNLARGAALVTSLRQLTSSREDLEYKSYSPARIIDSELACFAQELAARGITVCNEITANTSLSGYPDAFSQIVHQLIENALLHGLMEMDSGTIRWTAEARPPFLCISYRDNGKGMEENVRQRAFDPFFTTHFGRGESGLGLYRVHLLATAVLGGEVELSSTPGQGVQILFRLPLEAPIAQSTRQP